MKFIRVHSFVAAAAAGAMLIAGSAFANPTVAIAGPATVTPGGQLQLTVSASGFADLYAYQFDVNFDPAAFTSTSVTEGGFLSSQGSTFFDPGAVDNTDGTVQFVIDSLIGPEGGANGSGTLVDLTFNVGSNFAGTSSFTLSDVVGLDSFLNPIDLTVQGTSVSAVPEPSSWALALAGLGLMAGVKLRRNSKRNAMASC